MPDPMGTPGRLRLSFKALTQLPPGQTIQFARYKLGLLSGWYRRQTAVPPPIPEGLLPQPALPAPDLAQIADRLGEQGLQGLEERARTIQSGRLPVFNSTVNREHLVPPPPQAHWTALEGQTSELLEQDIKLVWEPSRFIWSLALAQATALTGNSEYARTLWDGMDLFMKANPAYLGWNWTSAQEAAFRLMAVAASWQWISSTIQVAAAEQAQVSLWIATHAGRIAHTLAYSRAQNNNHLLAEAAGLYTAGCFLPGHPAARGWRDRGWAWFQRGLLAQIEPDGCYSQHSTNYHRLMLHLALWVNALAAGQQHSFSTGVQERLRAATWWLMALTDGTSGRVPNLGPNDGADLLPLSLSPFSDFRPVLNAAGAAFADASLFPGPANETLRLWLGGKPASPAATSGLTPPARGISSTLLHLEHPDRTSWAYLRAVRFAGRPGHADQLHLDLWWQGHNLALDAGTYRYNDPPPWDNALVHTAVHNTVTINGLDQMTQAGRFLFLDWSQAEVEQFGWGEKGRAYRIVASQTGYRRAGITHRRTLLAETGGIWEVQDQLLATWPQRSSEPMQSRLHWLLPDAPWRSGNPGSQEQQRFEFQVAGTWITLEFSVRPLSNAAMDDPGVLQVYRAGESLLGGGPPRPTWGWVSRIYNEKVPALSVSLTTSLQPPLEFTTRWLIPPGVPNEGL